MDDDATRDDMLTSPNYARFDDGCGVCDGDVSWLSYS